VIERLSFAEAVCIGCSRRKGAQLDGLQLLPEIPPIEDVGALNAVQEALRSVARPEELRRFYAADER
jgi:hypothetical protein